LEKDASTNTENLPCKIIFNLFYRISFRANQPDITLYIYFLVLVVWNSKQVNFIERLRRLLRQEVFILRKNLKLFYSFLLELVIY